MTPPPVKIGKGNSLFYALIVGLFLTWQTISISYDRKNGLEIRTQQVPMAILTPCLVFMAAALGVNLGETLSKLSEFVAITSQTINSLKSEKVEEKIEEAVKEAIEETLKKEEKNESDQK